MDIPEDSLVEFTEPGLKQLLPRELKKEVRKEIHWSLWLRQKTYEEIKAITGFNRSTIWEDLKEVQEELARNPLDHQKTIQLAMLQLRMDHAEIIQRAREAKADGNASKLYKVAAEIQTTILKQFTQPANASEQLIRSEQNYAQGVIDFMVEKFGPESLDGFEIWWSKRRVAKATTE